LTSVLLSRVKSYSDNDRIGDCNNEKNGSTNKTVTTSVNETLDKQNTLARLHMNLGEILCPPGYLSDPRSHSRNSHNDVIQREVFKTLERACHMGRNVRWFTRLLTVALSIYRGEWIQHRLRHCRNYQRLGEQQEQSPNQTPPEQPPPKLQARHLLDALEAHRAPIVPQPSGPKGPQQGNHKRKHSSNHHHSNTNPAVINSDSRLADPRLRALVDLSPSQVALVLSARRILARDAQGNGETANPPPLTLGRMLQEYGKFAQTASQRYSQHLLWVAFQEMLETNLLRPASDHCGTGPFQFNHQAKVYNSVSEAEDAPLQLLVDVNREVMEALQSNLLECSTAMREWGRKTNT